MILFSVVLNSSVHVIMYRSVENCHLQKKNGNKLTDMKLNKKAPSSAFFVVLNVTEKLMFHLYFFCSYYFAALFGPEVQRKLVRIKKNITLIQMVIFHFAKGNDNGDCNFFFFHIFIHLQIQFTIILIQCALSLARGCEVPKLLLAIYVPNVLFIFYMFYDFFKKAYKKKGDLSKSK